jgi:transposase
MTQIPSSVEMRTVLGVDVGKASVAFNLQTSGAPRRPGSSYHVANTAEALRQAIADLQASGTIIDLIVCETTGGYERVLLGVALDLGVPAHRAHASMVKAYIASHARRAKTDAIDASWLADYGLDRFKTLQLWSRPDEKREELQSLVLYRQTLLDERTATSNRRKAPGSKAIAGWLTRQIDQLDTLIKEVEAGIEALSKQPAVATLFCALRAIPGIGPVAASAMVALLPELGTAGRRQIASLAGLAPHPRDSGTTNQRRTMTGGRSIVRKILYMAALSAARHHTDLKAFYDRLTDNHKPKKLALAAVARKLLTIANATARNALKGLNQNAAQLT